MRRAVYAIAALVLASMAQSPSIAPQFSVVSIRPASPAQDAEGSLHSIGNVDPAHWRVQGMGVSEMISYAYGMKINSYSRVVGLPDWGLSQEFNIQAVMPPGTRASQVPGMVKAMLADRFQLVAHIENRPMDAAALTVAPGGPKLQRSPECENLDPPPAAPIMDPKAPPPCGSWQTAREEKGGNTFYDYTFHGVTMAQLASFAESQKLPVVDQTRLAGAYDFTLERQMISAAMAKSLSKEEMDDLSARVQDQWLKAYTQQLGLVFGKTEKLPVPVVVVDHVSKPSPD